MASKPKKPKQGPPPVAPVRAEDATESGMTEALLASRRRQGLRSTILSTNYNTNMSGALGASSPKKSILGS